ncbi:MAG TPA: DUF2497 domain-containing protein [Xanthobacteraceae bacterium]|nr:DUF2497 domain-containing protein [Xanthobacteraceae bacterium]
MTQSAKAQEPSMEEILASIRRIIADDDSAKPASVTAAEAAPAIHAVPAAEPPRPVLVETAGKDEDAMPAAAVSPGDDREVLELTEDMAAPAPAPGFRTIDGQPDIVFDDGVSIKAEPVRNAAPPRPAEIETPADDHLLSAAATSMVDSAFNSLAHTVLVQNGRTLDDLVRDMLRPMLKTWLDDNLPGLVERLVRTEIERVSRGRNS